MWDHLSLTFINCLILNAEDKCDVSLHLFINEMIWYDNHDITFSQRHVTNKGYKARVEKENGWIIINKKNQLLLFLKDAKLVMPLIAAGRLDCTRDEEGFCHQYSESTGQEMKKITTTCFLSSSKTRYVFGIHMWTFTLTFKDTFPHESPSQYISLM